MNQHKANVTTRDVASAAGVSDSRVLNERFDPNESQRIVEFARGRGYEVPDDPERQARLFGHGWYKFAPDVAEKLLVNNGFSKDANGRWLSPDGSPWQIACLSNTVAVNHDARNCAPRLCF